MRNFREVELLAKKTVGDSGTETIDINVDEPITELTVRTYFKNDGATARAVPPESAVSKIEIVDGGHVYASLNGREATAVAWYDKLKWPAAWYSEIEDHGQYVEWPFQFGRFVGDEQYAFSPSRLLNPQLKVTWAKDTLHLTAVSTLEVNAKTLQGVSAPAQALLTKVIRSWTTLASGIQEVDLPTDYPYRRIYFRSGEPPGYIGNTWTNFKLECDVGKLIVFEMDDEELLQLMERTWGKATYDAIVAMSNGVNSFSHLGTLQGGSLVSRITHMIVAAGITMPGYAKIWVVNNDGVGQTDVAGVFSPKGLCPEYTYCYPFGRQDDPATWFNAPGYGSIKLKITEATAAGAASVFIQQPVPLP